RATAAVGSPGTGAGSRRGRAGTGAGVAWSVGVGFVNGDASSDGVASAATTVGAADTRAGATSAVLGRPGAVVASVPLNQLATGRAMAIATPSAAAAGPAATIRASV